MYIDRRPGKKEVPLLYKLIFVFSGFLISFLLIKLLIIPVRISENTMSPAIEKGDIVFFFRFLSPEKGDIVFLRDPVQPEHRGIRRVAATGGDSVEIKDKSLYINGEISKIPFNFTDNRIFPATFSGRDNLPLIHVPSDHVFLMGDNYDRVGDSRYYGPVSSDLIKGVLFFSL